MKKLVIAYLLVRMKYLFGLILVKGLEGWYNICFKMSTFGESDFEGGLKT